MPANRFDAPPEADLFREILDEQAGMVLRLDEEGRIVYANTACHEFFGQDLPERFVELFSPVLRRDLEDALNKLGGERQRASRELRLASGGGERWLEMTLRVLLDANGARRGVLVEGRDITTRKIAQEALLQVTGEKEHFRLNLEAIFQSIPDGIVTVDRDMRVIRANKNLAAILDLDEAGLAPGEVLNADQDRPCRAGLRQVVEQTLENRRGVREYRVDCRQDPRPRELVLNSSPLMDHHGTFAGAVVAVRDITRLADLERKLSERHSFQNIVGKSQAMRRVYDLLEQLAGVDTTVLVLGESGTGKELVVDALHYSGPRARGPLVKVNCSALTENLLESELFGHVKGAFTGATQDKVGRFQAAEGGTIFLDEIGDISPRIQLKLLRGLERKEFERVGDSRTYRVDTRVVAATNVDLLQKVKSGEFREDLYYRLKVVTVRLPPLRERKEDIPPLVEHFLEEFRGAFGKELEGVDENAMAQFMRYSWPGNVRELKHAMEHACILSRDSRIAVADLPQELQEQVSGQPEAGPAPSTSRKPAGLEREDILRALRETGGNKAKAARVLGISRRTLYRKMDELRVAP
ncbi:sigma-54-dependent Fis family transcriptional regulator [Desulfohalovibrio reitneri]|uniref:sigma-54-dependent Fis family transcriptional regulator n=1 Tax=Desulfohalovibrio reitneri TaxID=1307759 RepID=UPI00055196A2|nr:sigma-54-dependent Fis family transcriptional regulator [Desulfohalovibrio reitneri]